MKHPHTKIKGNLEEDYHKWGINNPLKLTSGRRFPLGYRTKGMILIDKIIFPIDKCTHCNSNKTWHRRCMDTKEPDNVWRYDNDKRKGTVLYKKYDFCLDCGKEFLIEAFFWKIKKR